MCLGLWVCDVCKSNMIRAHRNAREGPLHVGREFCLSVPHSTPSTWNGDRHSVHEYWNKWTCEIASTGHVPVFRGHTWVHSSCSFSKLLESQGPMPGSPWAEQGAASSWEIGSQDVQSSREQGCPFVPHNPLPALAPSFPTTRV